MKSKLLCFVALLVMFSLPSKSQVIKSKLDVAGGISAKEYIHLGLRYQYSEVTQIGVFVGNDLELKYNENISTLNLDHMIHFGKLNYYSNRPVWYQRIGFTLINNKYDIYNLNYSYIIVGMGREVAFNDRLGVNFDLGLNWQFRKYQNKPKIETPLDNRWYVMPLARIQLFYSF